MFSYSLLLSQRNDKLVNDYYETQSGVRTNFKQSSFVDEVLTFADLNHPFGYKSSRGIESDQGKSKHRDFAFQAHKG